ncbi:MAG: GumC family protein [Verrucomicrobiales bacterium]
MKQQQSEAKLHALDYWQVIRNRYGVILLSFFLVFMTAAVVTAIMPKKYAGRVLLEIERFSGTNLAFEDPVASMRNGSSQTFLQTEFKVITSKETLYQVIDKLGLVKRWNLQSKDDAYYKLRDMVEADEERGTDLIKITVFSTDAEEASELANTIARSYAERRTRTERERVNEAIEVIESTRKKQEERVELARAKVKELVEQYKIIDFTPTTGFGRGQEPNLGGQMLVSEAMRMEMETEKQIGDVTQRLQAIKNKVGDELISAAFSMGIMDPKTNAIYNPYLQDQTILQQMLSSGYGPKHPDVLAMKSRLDEERRLLDESVKSTRANLEDQLTMAQRTLTDMRRLKEEKKDNTIQEKSQIVDYQQAKDNYALQFDLLQKMVEEQEKAKLTIAMPKKPTTIHENAVVSKQYSKPNTKLQLGLGAVVGLVLGLGFAFFLEYLDTSVKTLDDVERYLGVPVLAVIPKDVGILHKQSGLSPDAEAYRILRTNIEFNRKSADANAITIVSGGAGEGKSTTLVNLAYICAQGGYNTLMIDGDLRRPKLHTFFDINNSVGLTNYLTTELMLEDVILQTPIDNLYFMPSGILPADAAGILNSRRMSELIADVKNRFDLVLIDSPPILGVSDASVLASEVDLTMIVIQHRKLPRSMLLRVKQAIENVGGNLLGVVLNNVDVRSDNQYQYYTSYYTYYSPTNTEAKAKPRPATKSAETASAKAPAAAGDGDEQY